MNILVITSTNFYGITIFTNHIILFIVITAALSGKIVKQQLSDGIIIFTYTNLLQIKSVEFSSPCNVQPFFDSRLVRGLFRNSGSGRLTRGVDDVESDLPGHVEGC